MDASPGSPSRSSLLPKLILHDYDATKLPPHSPFSVSFPGSRRSPRKLDRKPIYVLNLLVPPKKLDRNLEPAKAAVHFEVGSNQLLFLLPLSLQPAHPLTHSFLPSF